MKNADVHVPLFRLIEGATFVAAARRIAPGIRVKESTKIFSEGMVGKSATIQHIEFSVIPESILIGNPDCNLSESWMPDKVKRA